ncbi:MAG: glycoside hydrolase family 6 protein [Pseudomonadota bacterium]
MKNPKQLQRLLVLVSLLALLVNFICGPVMAHEKPVYEHNYYSRLFVPRPDQGAIQQILKLLINRKYSDAKLITRMIATPQAVWFVGGTPDSTEQYARDIVSRAAMQHSIPVLVTYNIPFRDCAQFSAGGATSVEQYKAWIDAIAAGLGDAQAIIILEPDSLGIIPWYTNLDGNLEWCQPAEADSATVANDRFVMLNYAIETLKANPNASVYLDGTHNAWLSVGDISQRLLRAGVQTVDGFFLNVSNFQYTANLTQYGTWVSSCIEYATVISAGDFNGCPNQYWNGGPLPSLIAQLFGEWNGVALSPQGEWSDTATDQVLNTSGINLRYANLLGAVQPTTHFVIDTSRNGQGPWLPTVSYPDPQEWCNPPGRGLGLRPSLHAGVPLLDAYLWVKIPGQSDGSCTRGRGPTGARVDPEWNRVDPTAGAWFPEMALELARKAVPPLGNPVLF